MPAVGGFYDGRCSLRILPPMEHAGKNVALVCDRGSASRRFLFGLSKIFWLSLGVLFSSSERSTGVSVIIPRFDCATGLRRMKCAARVSSVNNIFHRHIERVRPRLESGLTACAIWAGHFPSWQEGSERFLSFLGRRIAVAGRRERSARWIGLCAKHQGTDGFPRPSRGHRRAAQARRSLSYNQNAPCNENRAVGSGRRPGDSARQPDKKSKFLYG